MERVQQEFFSMGNLAQLAELPESLLNLPASESFNRIIFGDARAVLQKLPVDSVDLSFWSPPYYVGKSYERDLRFEERDSSASADIKTGWFSGDQYRRYSVFCRSGYAAFSSG